MTTLREFLQLDAREAVERIGTGAWLTVYSPRVKGADEGYFCALIPSAKLEDAMSRASWDLMIGTGGPGCSQSYPSGREPVTKYHRFGSDDGIEPLVFVREFHGMKRDYIELLEEFRHVFNLYHDRHNDRYIQISDSGEEETVAEVKDGSVRIRTRIIRQFLAIRRMHLLVFFDSVVHGDIDLNVIPATDRSAERATETVRYSFYVSDARLVSASGQAFSRLLGKVAVPPLAIEQCGIWPYEEKEQFAEFIIGVDEDSQPILHTCDPEALDNHFGKTPGAPHFLTPVVFRRDVLQKYYEHPEKYSVEDGYLHCGGLWGLDIDNDAADRVVVFLGDLGKSLSYQEQLHWKSRNIPPEGKDLSDTSIKRALHGEFADPESPELVFKDGFTDFQEAWEKRFGWPLIRPLREPDGHVFKRLHAPTTTSASEFEDQLLLLAKLLVDSLNDAKLVEALGSTVPDEKSISKLERFLTAKGYPETRRDIEFLRLLQDARSQATAHRKGDSYAKVAQKLRLENRPTSEVFAELLQSATVMLQGLRTFFLPSDDVKERA